MFKIVKVSSECLVCLRHLIESTAKAACASAVLRERAVKEAWNVVQQMKTNALSPAYLANRFHPIIKEICRNPDPFVQQKRQEMVIASELTQHHRPFQNASFRDLLVFAARGNVIDFFRPVEELEQWFLQPVHFDIDHIGLLERSLQRKKQAVLWLADNAGEIFFDLPFLENLSQKGHQIYYAVKAAGVQNDLTLEDLQNWPMGNLPMEVVDTGVATVGLELDHISDRFRCLYNSVDLIIGKGMGHFETLAHQDDPRLFLLFMAKCVPVARTLGVSLNHFVAYFVSGGNSAGK
jgi:uncharacterized protein with ATP-grasp and redox domains